MTMLLKRPVPYTAATGQKRRARCIGERKDGELCRMWAVTGSQFCSWHDPDRRLDREEAQERRARQREQRPLASASGWLLDLETPA